MKKIFSLIAAVTICISAMAQNKKLPNTSVRDIKGKKIAFNKAFEAGKVTIVSFWATWCIPCKQEIKAINTKLPDWQKKNANINYAVVSIDDARATAAVKTYATAQGWTFPVLLDPNSDLKRTLNFSNVPFAIIIDKEGNIAYMHTGYEEGGENELFEKALALATAK
jgi:cytochrome c biogenesis protein CcmG, thiol:disulfide interchange protein DsbE